LAEADQLIRKESFCKKNFGGGRIMAMKDISSPELIYETPDYVVLNKPAGVLVHRVKIKDGETRDEPTLADLVAERYPEVKKVGDDPETRPGIVHRLDKETSGVIIVARTQEYFEYLKKLFQDKKITKKYTALVYGDVKENEGVIDKSIGLKSGTIKRTVHGGRMVKEAITHYKVIGRYDGYTLLEVFPKTGRTHQIRVHLASIGHPIVGDSLYGGKKEKRSDTGAGRQFLHAGSIEFEAKPGELVSFASELPDDLVGVLNKLPESEQE
jgi:23S rRNA pseudouridine1911/1915/1917 synthase